MELTLLKTKEEIQTALQREEKLLKARGNFCIINTGVKDAVVLGITSKEEELVDKKAKGQIAILRRFSAGGCVLLDQGSIIVTFILESQRRHFPEEILGWAYDFYKNAFNIPQLELKENDFTVGDKKCGGNALYIREKKYLLHTSFLFDFDEEKMKLLLLPQKAPAYRQMRSHADFLVRLKQYFQDKNDFEKRIEKELLKRFTLTNSPRRTATPLPFNLKNRWDRSL